MPELPEVEAVVRTLGPLVQNRRIRCVHVLHPIATKPQAASHLARFAQGRRIRTVGRKGKYVLLHLDSGLLTMHFGLDGQLLWFWNAKEFLERANQGENAVHVELALECCLHPAPYFPAPASWFQGLETILRAYGREGKPCRRCGTPMRRIAQGTRSTYCCARCQK